MWEQSQFIHPCGFVDSVQRGGHLVPLQGPEKYWYFKAKLEIEKYKVTHHIRIIYCKIC